MRTGRGTQMRGVIHGVTLAVATITMVTCSVGRIWAGSARPALQAAPQVAVPPARTDRGEAHGKAVPPKPAVPNAPEAAAASATAGPGEAHGKAVPGKPAVPNAPQAAAASATARPGEAHGTALPGKPSTPSTPHGAASGEAGHGAASAGPTNASAGKGPAADPVAHATNAVELVNRIMAEQTAKRTRPPVRQAGSIVGPPHKARVAATVRPRSLLTWDAFLVPNGVALVWENDLTARPARAGRDLGVRLIWQR